MYFFFLSRLWIKVNFSSKWSLNFIDKTDERKDFLTRNLNSAGHECWDHVSVWSCWGRCDSREISDWKFPYKKSYHPVCVHAGRSKAVAMLRFCHPLADPETRRYEYLEANSCHCQVKNITKLEINATK